MKGDAEGERAALVKEYSGAPYKKVQDLQNLYVPVMDVFGGAGWVRNGAYWGADLDAANERTAVAFYAPVGMAQIIDAVIVVVPQAAATHRIQHMIKATALDENVGAGATSASPDYVWAAGDVNEIKECDVSTELAIQALAEGDYVSIDILASATNTPDVLVLGFRLTWR